jgi:hypothetical protein
MHATILYTMMHTLYMILFYGAIFTDVAFYRCYWWCLANIYISYSYRARRHRNAFKYYYWCYAHDNWSQEVILPMCVTHSRFCLIWFLILMCLNMLHISLLMMFVIIPIRQCCRYVYSLYTPVIGFISSHRCNAIFFCVYITMYYII